MILERIVSEGLAHFSYLVGDQNQAVVIDPRRDCDVYIEQASQAGLRIIHVLETHRNEDYLVGTLELSSRTGASMWHADQQLDYQYGQAVEDGQTWQVGRFQLEAILSPGHTPGSMSYLLRDLGGEPWVVFTGDTLFAGDVGRVDFLGSDMAEEMAGLLYDTVFGKILALGDGVIVCPAHGPGSVCASQIAERTWTTVGLERRLNPRLQHEDRDAFIADVAQNLEKSPYFRYMEDWNTEGPAILDGVPIPVPLSPFEFASLSQDAVVLDTRGDLGFGSAHVPEAISIWLGRLSSYAGWFLPYDRPILLVTEAGELDQVVRQLMRLGFDQLAGCLPGGMSAWHTAGYESQSIRTVTVQDLCRDLDQGQEIWNLDVRSNAEVQEAGYISGAHHVPTTEILERMQEVPRDQPVHIFCGSGVRAMTVASLLKREGWQDLTVVLGGISAWNSTSCPVEL